MIDHDARFDTPRTHQHPPSLDQLSAWIGEEVLSAQALSGGFHNQNLKISTTAYPTPLVFRRCQCPGWMFRREVALCERAKARVPTPTCIRHGEEPSGDYSWGLFEWLEGMPMHHALAKTYTTKANQRDLFWQCGATLAKLHTITFDKPGFFDETLDVVEPFDTIGQAFWHYMDQCLHDVRVQRRLGQNATQKTLKTLEKHQTMLFKLEHQCALVHSDFNTKNIFVHRNSGTDPWSICAVMDWEFAYSGSPLSDLGNFLRFEEDVSTALTDAFIEGYQHHTQVALPSRWRTLSMLLDMTALLNMFTRDELGPKTQHTATDKLIDYVERLQ